LGSFLGTVGAPTPAKIFFRPENGPFSTDGRKTGHSPGHWLFSALGTGLDRAGPGRSDPALGRARKWTSRPPWGSKPGGGMDRTTRPLKKTYMECHVKCHSELFRALASRPVSRWPPLCGQNAPSETWQNQKVRAGGPQGVARGAENGFFCQKWSLFDFRPHNSPLFDEIRGVLGVFAKKCFKTIFFVRFFFDFCHFFASAGSWPCTALHCRGPSHYLADFGHVKKCPKNAKKKIDFFFRLQMGSSGL